MSRQIILIVLALILIGHNLLLADNKETTKTVIPEPGSKNAELVTKQDVVTDSTGKVIRIINYLRDDFARKNGFNIQIDEYSPYGYPSSFTMLFTKEHQSVTGFTKRVDFVNQQDELLRADFYIDESIAFTASKDDIKAFERYPPHRMGQYFEENHSDSLKENEYSIESPVFGGTTFATYRNAMKDIGPHEKYLIAAWSKMHSSAGFIPLYNKEILVKERGKEYWVCFQDELLKYLSTDLDMTFRYYYIGESIEGMTFLVTFMTERRRNSGSNETKLGMSFENGAYNKSLKPTP